MYFVYLIFTNQNYCNIFNASTKRIRYDILRKWTELLKKNAHEKNHQAKKTYLFSCLTVKAL